MNTFQASHNRDSTRPVQQGIIINLLLIPGYFDVALRDFGLMLGALALGRLSESVSQS